MAFRFRYSCAVDWVGPGMGLGQNAAPLAAAANTASGTMTPAGNAQTLEFNNGSFNATPATSSTFTSTDITNFLSAMSTDLSTQLNASIARVQGFASGGG